MPKKEAEKTEISDGLLVMEKDGEEIRVHPRQVGPWQAQGWTVKEDQEED